MPDDAEFEPFDLSVLYAGNPAGIWLSASSRLGAVNAVPRRDPILFPLQDLADDAKWFRSAIGEGRSVPDQGAQFGGLMRNLVFGVDEISSLFRRTRGAAYAASRPLLVRLLAAPEPVAALPWELLLDPEDPRTPLIFAPDVHFTRAARHRRYPLRLDLVTPPLHVLLVLSNPNPSQVGEDDAPFDHYEEGRALLAELQDLVDRGIMLVDVEDRPSIENLRRRIGARERGYHVVHYLGHARPDALKLEDRAGMPSWITSEKFNGLLRVNPDLRLVFFAGCRTASLTASSDGDFTSQLSIADRCVRDACQTVLGMQAVLPFRAEQVITRFFYQALCTGASVVRALSLARAATRDDEMLGRDLLNWAVPSLVAGQVPGRIVSPQPQTGPPLASRPRQRAQLKLDLTEPDREFFARFAQLRETLTVLCRLGPNRVVWVTGPPASGKSRLLARALNELDASIDAVLYVRATRLADAEGPAAALCSLVNELLQKAERQGVERRPGWTPAEWWDRLIEELIDTPFVMAIDDLDLVDSPAATALGAVIDRLVARVSKARVALASTEILEGFLSAGTRLLVSPVHVLTLEPGEVIQWLLRNRPTLATALAGMTKSDQSLIHNRLGFKLHLWARLAEEYDRQLVKDLTTAVELVASAEAAATPPTPPPTVAPPSPTETEPPATRGPIRVAIAGPYTRGRQQQFADGIGALALQHGAGTRVVPGNAPDAGTAVAQLLPVDSPFTEVGTASDADMVAWLEALLEKRPDIVLLDYGADSPNAAQERALRALANAGSLLVAAGGNSGQPEYPAWHSFVLAVGALAENGRPATYSKFFADVGKPNLYALGTVAGTPLEDILALPGKAVGTSIAALNVVAAATIVWGLDRTLTAKHVRRLLDVTARQDARPGGLKQLANDAALNAVRARLVMRALLSGPLDEQGIAAASGLGPDVTDPLLKSMIDNGTVRMESGRYVGDPTALTQELANPGRSHHDGPSAGNGLIARQIAMLHEFDVSPEQGLSSAQASAAFKKHGLDPRSFGCWVKGGYVARVDDRRWLTDKGRGWADSKSK